MRTGGGHTRIDWTDPRLTGLAESDRAWLQRELGGGPSIDDVNQLVERPNLSRAERAIAQAFKQTLLGSATMRGGSENKVIGSQGFLSAVDLRADTLRAARKVSGETDVEAKVRAALPASLIGHEDQIDVFAELARRYMSPMRQTPTVAVLMGGRGHGKEQALAAYAKLVCGDEAQVIDVDLNGLAPPQIMALFGEKGPLALERLKSLEPNLKAAESGAGGKGKKTKTTGGLVRILGAEGLLAAKPEAAQRFMALLTARKGEPGYANVQYFFDFERPVTHTQNRDDVLKTARQLLTETLGAPGTRTHAGTAVFANLSEASLGRYAQALLEKIMKEPALGSLALDIDPDAFALLCEALTTPHAPLEEIDVRLYEFLTSKFDTHTSVDREGGVLRVSVATEFADDPQLKQAVLRELHEEYADLTLGNRLFAVQEVAKHASTEDPRDTALSYVPTLVDILSARALQMLMTPPTDDPETLNAVAALAGAMQELSRAFESSHVMARKQHALNSAVLLTPDRAQALQRAFDALNQQRVIFESLPQGQLQPVWQAELSKAVGAWCQAAELILDAMGVWSKKS